MQENIQELHDFIKEKFPKLGDKVIYKILFSIKERLIKYKNNIGFSRYECEKFGISEKKLRQVIDYLRQFRILEYSHSTISTKRNLSNRLCNVYKIGERFKEMFMSLERFINKPFEYINPLIILHYVKFKFKRNKYLFEIQGNLYMIQKKGKFKDKIYGIEENKIINPYELLKLLT